MGSRFKLSTKLMVLGLGGVFCFTLVLGWVYARMADRIYGSKEALLKDVVEVAFSLMTEYENRVKTGELSPEEAKARAALRVKSLRYSGQEYFWINDLEPRMIMHPYKPELDGKSLAESADPHGKFLFREMVRVCKESGAGFVNYMWPKPGAATPVPKISYVRLFQPWGWILGSGVYVDDITAELRDVRFIFLGVILVMAVGGILFSWIVARNTARPINRAIEGLTANSEQVAIASDHISTASQQVAEGASEQAAAIEETSSSLEELSSMTKHNAENAREAHQLMKKTNAIVTGATESMHRLTSSMEEISQASEQTQKIIKTIDEIAFQTNLLALNAAVEAARAGEAGAGFAVVADEVRNLAMRAAESARNTAVLIESTVKKVQAGADLMGKTNQEFNQVETMVTQSGGLIGEIAAASSEQAQGIEHLNQAVQQMDAVVQQNAANAEQTASVAQEMKRQTKLIEGLMNDLGKLIGSRERDRGAEPNPSTDFRLSEVKPVRRAVVQHVTVMGEGAPKLNGHRRQPKRIKEIPLHQGMPGKEEEFEEF